MEPLPFSDLAASAITAPFFARAPAIIGPIPLAPPVIRTIFPLNSMTFPG